MKIFRAPKANEESGDTFLSPLSLDRSGANASRRMDKPPSRVIYAAVLFVVFVCGALIATSTWLIVRARAAEIEQISRSNLNLARAVSQQIAGSIGLAEHIISGIVFELERADITQVTLQRLQPVLVTQVSQAEGIKGLFVYDELGRWIVHSEALVDPIRNNSDRDYFVHHKNNQSARPLISGPVISRSSGEWVIPVSRRINDPEGNFAGVVLATLSVSKLLSVLGSFQIGEQGAIALFTPELLLVRRPFREADMGRRNGVTPIQKAVQASRSGTIEGFSTIDNLTRIISFQHLENYPLFATVAVSKDEALREWRSASFYQASWAALLSVSIAISGRYLIRSMRRRLTAEQRLRSARDALAEANERLKHLAQEDGLTGLANRRYFDARLVRAFQEAQENKAPLAIVMIDVDEFKKYNDLYGHLEGDECLRKVAQALRSAVQRSDDLIARYGGEELVLLLPNTHGAQAVEVAERARLAVLALQISHGATKLGFVSVSLGVAAGVPRPSNTPIELMKSADEALYKAKQEGKNTVCLYGRNPH